MATHLSSIKHRNIPIAINMTQGVQFLAPEPIHLTDNESPAENSPQRSLHFKQITVGDCTIVNGQRSKFSVWQIQLVLSPRSNTGNSSPHIQLYKRYSDFVVFRESLLGSLPPDLRKSVPELPPRVSWYDSWRYQEANFNSSWLARRRAGLEFFLNQVLLNDKLLAKAGTCIRAFLEN